MLSKAKNISKVIKYLLVIFLFISLYLNVNGQVLQDSANFKVFRYVNGNKSSEGFMINDKPDRYWKTYFENGVLKSEGNRFNFELDSVWKFYNEKGETILEINYKNGLKNGKRKTYTENEIVEENFENDIKNGLSNYYFLDGKLKKTLNFINGKESGISKEYTQEGLVIAITEYKNGSLIRRENINRTDRNAKKQGVWKFFFDDGSLQLEGFYVNGKKNGFFKDYNKEGVLLSITKYIEDEIQKDVPELAEYDLRTDYYTDGSVKVVGSYKNGVAEGIRREYAQDGKIKNAFFFEKGNITGEGIVDEKGLRQGFWKEYYDNGKLRSEGIYTNNVKTGDWKFYTENAIIKQVGKFNKNGFQTGEWKWYYENGKIQKTENFENGVLQGLMEEYDEKEVLIAKGNYEEGNEDGSWFFTTTNYRQEGTYSYGRRNGIWKHYYDNGQLKFEGNFLDDYPDGKHVFYWENGKIMEERTYVMGKAEGTWKKYDENGVLFLYTDYKHGIEYRYDGVFIKPVIDD